MSTKTYDLLVCDNCGKEVKAEKTLYFGGHPFSGWVKVDIKHSSSQFPKPSEDEEYDFCSKSCCIEKFTKEKNENT